MTSGGASGSFWFLLCVVLVTVAVTLLVVLPLTVRGGDGGASPLPAAVPEAGKIVLLTGQDDSQTHAREKLIQRWNDTHKTNPVEIQSLPSDADKQHSEMVARAQDDQRPVDVFDLDVTWVAEFAAAGYLRELPAPPAGSFVGHTAETGSFDGRQWALPFNTDAGLLFYHPSMLKPEQVPRQWPPSPQEVAPLLAGHPGLAAAYAGQFAPNYEGMTVNALEAIWSAHGDVVDDGSVVVGSAAAAAGLRNLAAALRPLRTTARLTSPVPSACAPGRPTTTPQQYVALPSCQEADATRAFKSGQVAMMRNWPVQYDTVAAGDQPSRDVAVTGLPGVSALGGQDLAISANSTKPAATQQLIEFLTSESSQEMLGAAGFAPVHVAAYKAAGVIKGHEYMPGLLAAVTTARPRPATAHYFLFSTAFRAIVKEAIAAGGTLPRDASDRLAAALQGELGG
jgi:multiple sugar transport system substrate-binding protein